MRLPTALTSTLKISLLYLLFGVAWILFSDQVLAGLTDTAAAYEQWQTYKGWAFVAGSTALIYWLVGREERARRWGRTLLTEVCRLTPDPMSVRRLETGRFLTVNDGFARQIGRSRDEITGSTLEELEIGFDAEARMAYEARLDQEGGVHDVRVPVHWPDGSRQTLLMSSRLLTLNGEDYNLTVTKDITELEREQAFAREQLERVRALREIDRAITGTLDLQVSLNVVLEQVTEHLEVDAATVLLVNGERRSLRYAVGRGFRTRALRHTRLEFGEGYAGQAAEDRSLVVVDDLSGKRNGFIRSDLLEEEGFVGYAAAPLVAKEQVNGVLEVFRRQPLDPSQDWLDFLDALAAQTAIAVDNASLLQDLQRSNQQIRDAYDETIEGWARALDLRDRETHGHTKRVAEVTVRLAEQMGVPDEELIHVRRGGLLHDIGKMGVPDAILLKPGPLDDEEWDVMKRHPELAFRLLSPIEFLRPALDIPHYHHEKWDGSGYPDGLHGDEIPLAARIFAVVDVWDALLSDRPYRDAWDEEEVHEHLREESGAHFDPEVVEAFFCLDLEAIPIPERSEPEEVPGRQADIFEEGEEEEG